MAVTGRLVGLLLSFMCSSSVQLSFRFFVSLVVPGEPRKEQNLVQRPGLSSLGEEDTVLFSVELVLVFTDILLTVGKKRKEKERPLSICDSAADT